MGLQTYHPKPLFSPTLFVELRKKLGEDTFGEFSQTLITLSENSEGAAGGPDAAKPAPNGKLKIDATVADQYVRYPNDLSLVNKARVKTEAIIDQLWELTSGQLSVKPRTYRKLAHKRYLSQAKKKNSSRSALRKTLRYLLNCVQRNRGHIDRMLDLIGRRPFPLAFRYQRQLWIIAALYAHRMCVRLCAARPANA